MEALEEWRVGMASDQKCKWICDNCGEEAENSSADFLPMGWSEMFLCEKNRLSTHRHSMDVCGQCSIEEVSVFRKLYKRLKSTLKGKD